MTTSMKRHRRCAVPSKPIYLGLLLWLGVTGHEARAENCRLSISQPQVEYGIIRPEHADERSTVAPGTRTLHLNIQCAQPSAIGVRFNGTPADGQSFRFGREGRFRVRLRHALVDGRAVQWAVAHAPGETTSGQLLPGKALLAQVPGRRLSAQVDIDVELPFSALQVRSLTLLEGQGSFEWVSSAVPLNQ